MWAKWIGVAGGVFGIATAAMAQFPGGGFAPYGGGQQTPGQPGYNMQPYLGGGGGSPGVLPNYYNPQYQPLSPYLNLFRGSNPAVNYYYGVRPGTVGGAGSFGGAPNIAMGGNRSTFFPQLAAGPDPFNPEDPETGQGANVLPPAGHPVVFGNTLGYFPGSYGTGGRNRPGLAGSGNRSTATPKR